MKILIADDSDDKQVSLKTLLELEFRDVELSYTKALNTTFSEIRKSFFDLVLLDMTMPSFEDANGEDVDVNLKTLAGKEIIGKIAYRKISVPVIIVTAFEVFGRHDNLKHISTIYNELMQSYPDIVKGYVFFDIQSDDWKTQLIKEVKKVLNV